MNEPLNIADDETAQSGCEKELEALREEYANYAYIVSHDLKAPFRQMGGFADLLQAQMGDQLDEKSQKFLGYIISSAARGQSLIDALLEFSRVNTQAKSFETTDCNHCTSSALEELEELIASSEAVITVEALPTIHADSKQIVQLMYHLVKNALSYQPEGNIPRVTVSAEQVDAGQWQFCVTDNGIGVKELNHERIFAVLRRGVPEDKYAGNGIGLAVAKKIVERHSGAIWFDEKVEAGARIYFTLPASS
ncbi:MAG: ATP-binding protein [Rickettsiales bacterium]|nr:ATP-binding protein [Rickettsiales bacterium]